MLEVTSYSGLLIEQGAHSMKSATIMSNSDLTSKLKVKAKKSNLPFTQAVANPKPQLTTWDIEMVSSKI